MSRSPRDSKRSSPSRRIQIRSFRHFSATDPAERGRGAATRQVRSFPMKVSLAPRLQRRRVMRTRPFLIAMMFALGSVPLFPGLQWAQQSASRYVVMTWSFKSTPPDIVYLQLYGPDNKNVWPAPDKYYKLDGRAAHKARIT